MRTDREAQGKQRGPGKDTGPWGGEFLCYFGKTGTLGKTRTLEWGIPMLFLGIVEKMI